MYVVHAVMLNPVDGDDESLTCGLQLLVCQNDTCCLSNTSVLGSVLTSGQQHLLQTEIACHAENLEGTPRQPKATVNPWHPQSYRKPCTRAAAKQLQSASLVSANTAGGGCSAVATVNGILRLQPQLHLHFVCS